MKEGFKKAMGEWLLSGLIPTGCGVEDDFHFEATDPIKHTEEFDNDHN